MSREPFYTPGTELMNHALWEGSILQLRWKHKVLTASDIQKEAERKGRIPDSELTPNERSYRDLLVTESYIIEDMWHFED